MCLHGASTQRIGNVYGLLLLFSIVSTHVTPIHPFQEIFLEAPKLEAIFTSFKIQRFILFASGYFYMWHFNYFCVQIIFSRRDEVYRERFRLPDFYMYHASSQEFANNKCLIDSFYQKQNHFLTGLTSVFELVYFWFSLISPTFQCPTKLNYIRHQMFHNIFLQV